MSRQEGPTDPARLGARVRSLMSGGRPRAIASLGIVLGLGAIGTLAAWSDSATATSGVFSTGSIDLQLNDDPGNPTAYAFASLTKTGMMPGSSVAATLPVQNKGSAGFSYTMAAATTSSPLAPFLKVSVSSGGTSNGSTCSGGTAVASNVALVSGASAPVVGTARPLAANTSETLCFQVTLDSTATTAVQNQTLNASFNFNAATA